MAAAADYKKSSVENGWMKGANGGRDHREVHRSLLWGGGGGGGGRGSSKGESTRKICSTNERNFFLAFHFLH